MTRKTRKQRQIDWITAYLTEEVHKLPQEKQVEALNLVKEVILKVYVENSPIPTNTYLEKLFRAFNLWDNNEIRRVFPYPGAINADQVLMYLVTMIYVSQTYELKHNDYLFITYIYSGYTAHQSNTKQSVPEYSLELWDEFYQHPLCGGKSPSVTIMQTLLLFQLVEQHLTPQPSSMMEGFLMAKFDEGKDFQRVMQLFLAGWGEGEEAAQIQAMESILSLPEDLYDSLIEVELKSARELIVSIERSVWDNVFFYSDSEEAVEPALR